MKVGKGKSSKDSLIEMIIKCVRHRDTHVPDKMQELLTFNIERYVFNHNGSGNDVSFARWRRR